LRGFIIKVPAQKFFYFPKILHRDNNLFFYVISLQEKAIHINEIFYKENLAVTVIKGEGREDWLDRIAVSREISVSSQ
jgi:hypothetical protein